MEALEGQDLAEESRCVSGVLCEPHQKGRWPSFSRNTCSKFRNKRKSQLAIPITILSVCRACSGSSIHCPAGPVVYQLISIKLEPAFAPRKT